jgi:hypothetical protein
MTPARARDPVRLSRLSRLRRRGGTEKPNNIKRVPVVPVVPPDAHSYVRAYLSLFFTGTSGTTGTTVDLTASLLSRLPRAGGTGRDSRA